MAMHRMKWTACGLALTLGLGSMGSAAAASIKVGSNPAVASTTASIVSGEELTHRPVEHPRSHQDKMGEQRHPRHDRQAAEHRAYSDAAAVLGVTVEKLQEQLESGKSLADIAASKGMSKEKLVQALTAKTAVRLDEAVKSGKLPADTVGRLKEKLADKWTERVEMKGFAFAPKPHGNREHRQMMAGQFTRIAAMIGISKEELEKRLNEGQSLAEIAQAEGISRQTLIARIKEDLTPVLEKMIDAKRPARTNPAPADKS